MADNVKDSVFSILNSRDVGKHIEKKNGLSYVSWAWAMAEVQEVYPDMTYTIWRDEQGRPYIFDPELGYMVFTSITIQGITRDMWLPVMDNSNNAMKNVKYKLNKGRRSYDVEPATMFDVNTAIMRCLVKNLAMFGLGLYIYAGEDLPEDADAVSTADGKGSTVPKMKKDTEHARPSTKPTPASTKPAPEETPKYWQDKISEFADAHNMTTTEICNDYHIGIHSSVEKLKEVYADLTAPKAEPKEEPKQDEMPDFAAIDEPEPFV